MEALVERVNQFFAPIMSTMEPYLPLIAGVSIVMFLASVIIIPFLIVKMPADYFMDRRRKRNWTFSHVLIYVLRNTLAFILFVAGLLMLVLPGQGLLTLIIAAVVSDFPGKFTFERWLLRRKGVLRSINWIRKRYDKPKIEAPEKVKKPKS
ncbi:hypothetical protein A28LD_0548 [Idiomarina sp. A28L]|uniref:hypothetical protein n=1 Tax=Idiomarina sp. A28L TaxID=1036674 RepID=UPI0002138D19|nr:hypothetical protein [Idiomarina sp. A28L]EGN76060.1 hypothetical protein A28LD_0548 [Idiomarina sp. A28L]